MRKKILNHTCILVVVSVLLTFLAAGLVMYGKYNEDLKESVRDSLKYVQDGVEKMGNSYLDDALGKATSARITLLDPKGNVLFDSLEKFAENWKAKKWEPQGSFCLPLDKVEVLEVKQEESTNNTREQLRAHGFDLTPRKQTDRGGIICLPLDKNLNGDVQAKHPDWEPVECPTCGRKCWKHPEADRLAKEQGAKMLCTECAIKAGLLSPFRKEGPNRAQRRRAKRERRK
jgi:hypothetical protein